MAPTSGPRRRRPGSPPPRGPEGVSTRVASEPPPSGRGAYQLDALESACDRRILGPCLPPRKTGAISPAWRFATAAMILCQIVLGNHANFVYSDVFQLYLPMIVFGAIAAGSLLGLVPPFATMPLERLLLVAAGAVLVGFLGVAHVTPLGVLWVALPIVAFGIYLCRVLCDVPLRTVCLGPRRRGRAPLPPLRRHGRRPRRRSRARRRGLRRLRSDAPRSCAAHDRRRDVNRPLGHRLPDDGRARGEVVRRDARARPPRLGADALADLQRPSSAPTFSGRRAAAGS